MSINSMDDFTFKHSNQLDAIYTQYTGPQIKALFDSRGDELRTALNVLITKLNDISITADLNTPALTPTSGTTVKDQLSYLLTQVGQVALGNIPDGSVELVKLAQDVINKMNMPLNQIGAVIDESGNLSNLATPDITSIVNGINSLLTDMKYQTATGTANAIVLTTGALVDGYSKTFIASANNNGTSTTINGKPLYKPNTAVTPSLIAGKAYTVWYEETSDCFFIKASSEGDATPDKVLAGETFSNKDDTGLTGTLTLSGDAGDAQVLSGKTYYNNSALTKRTGTMPTKEAQTYTPSTTNQTISANQYLNGAQTILGDADLIASNILNTANIFNIQGTAIAGRRSATGTVTSSTSYTTFTYVSGSTYLNTYKITVTGLSFKPSLIIAKYTDGTNQTYVIQYDEIGAETYPKTVKLTRAYTTSTTSNTMQNFKGDVSPATVYNGGFTLPAIPSDCVFTWLAIE